MFGDVIINSKKWPIETWNDVLTITNGKNQKDVVSETGKYPIYGTGGIFGYANDYLCNENSIIIGRKGTINNPLLVREKFWNVDTAFGVTPRSMLCIEYLYCFCKIFDFESLDKSTTIPSLVKTDLLKIIIPVPPIELQNQFADFVKQVDKSKYMISSKIEKEEGS